MMNTTNVIKLLKRLNISVIKKCRPANLLFVALAVLASSPVKADSTYDTLYEAIKATTASRTYTLEDDEPALGGDGYGAMNGTSLTVVGGIYAINGGSKTGITVGSGKQLNITGGTWAGFATANGGVINNAGTVSITDSTFTSNTASTSGGAIYNTGTLSIIASENGATSFSSNTANEAANDIYNTGTLNLTANTNGSITLDGGVINEGAEKTNGTMNVSGAGNVYINGYTRQNTISIASGAKLTIGDAYLNTLSGITNSGTLTITDVEGENDATNLASGKHYLDNNGGATATVSGQFTNNDHHLNTGYAVFKNRSNASLTLNNATLSNNNATYGNINNYGVLSVNTASFVSNEAGWGGAIYASGANSQMTIKGAEFIGNYGRWKGGAIYLEKNTKNNTFGESSNLLTFRGNYATEQGGAIFVSDKSEIDKLFANFTNNSITGMNNSERKGGAIEIAWGGAIGDIVGDFISNSISSSNKNV